MLRTLLIASALLAASGTAFAHDYERHGRVVRVEPYFAISFGTPYPEGFRVLYESGGSRYWTYSADYPGPTIVLPPRYEVRRVYRYREYGDDWRERRGWHEGRHGRRFHDDDD